MSLVVGKSRVRISKYIVIELLSFVFKDFQLFELLLKVSRDSFRIAVNNRTLIKTMCQEKGIVFSLPPDLPLNTVCTGHLSRVGLFRLKGAFQIGDGLEDVEALKAIDPNKVQLEQLTYCQGPLTIVKPSEDTEVQNKEDEIDDYGEYYDYQDEVELLMPPK